MYGIEDKFEINEDFKKAYLTDENGNVASDLVAGYKNIYDQLYLKLMVKQNELKEEMAQIDDAIQQTTFYSDDDYDDIDSDEESTQVSFGIDEYCHSVVQRFFQISKLASGYDFSDLNNKLRVAMDMINYSSGFILETSIEKICDDLIEYCKDDQNNVDYRLISNVVSLMNGAESLYPVDYAVNLIKRFYVLDETSKREIFQMMLNVNDSVFVMDEETNDFETLMELCFDSDNKFNPKRADALVDAIDLTAEWIDSNMQKARDFDEERWDSRMIQVMGIAVDEICNYFSVSTDESGKFNPKMSPEKYFDNSLNSITVF